MKKLLFFILFGCFYLALCSQEVKNDIPKSGINVRITRTSSDGSINSNKVVKFENKSLSRGIKKSKKVIKKQPDVGVVEYAVIYKS